MLEQTNLLVTLIELTTQLTTARYWTMCERILLLSTARNSTLGINNNLFETKPLKLDLRSPGIYKRGFRSTCYNV